jgi:hypothetical protein
MKQKILIFGILLIAGLLLAGPASAATLVDKNTHTVYSTKFHCYGTMTYNTYKISTTHYRTYIYIKYKNGKIGNAQMDITKISSNKIKVAGVQNTGGVKSYYTKYFYTSWSVYKFYFSEFKYVLRSM